MEKSQSSQWREHSPFHGPFDPCPPRPKRFVVPPNLYVTMQKPGMKQFDPREALQHGTLWPELYSPYPYADKEAKR